MRNLLREYGLVYCDYRWKKIAEELRDKIKSDIKKLPIKQPGLTVILIGEHPASQIYVRNKEKFANEVGINQVF